MLLVLSCAQKDVGVNASSRSQTGPAGENSVLENDAGKVSSGEGDIMPADWYEPLPPEYLSEIDVEHTPPLSFNVWIADNTLPPPQGPMSWGIVYDNGDQTLTCRGFRHRGSEHYGGIIDPGYKDDFVDLIQYIQSEPEFFTYDEFVEAAPGEMNKPEQFDIWIGVTIEGYDYVLNEHANTYAIQKFAQGTPSVAMQHVIDVMRTVFLPEVLNNQS